jgi:hypothetical protein
MNIARLALSLPRRSIETAGRVALAAAGLLRAAEQVPILMIRVEALLTAVEITVRQTDETISAARTVVGQVENVRVEATRVVGEIDTVQQRAARLVETIEPLVAVASTIDPALVRSTVKILDDLQPLLRSFTLLAPDVVDNAMQLVRRVLPMVEKLDPIMEPLLVELVASLPEIREILAVVTRLEPVMTDVETRIAGLPGAGLMRKRGEREIEAVAAAESAEDAEA